MVDHWRWQRSIRVQRWARLTTAGALLLSCALLAGFAPSASASTPEEKLAREAVRGEWALTLEYGQTIKGTALITEEANAENEFSSSSVLFENIVPGTFSGKFEGKEASVKGTSEAAGKYPATTFNATKMTVTLTSDTISLTGKGTLTVEKTTIPVTMTATRIKTYQEVVARETAEREAKEKQEKEAQEAKEKVEREAKAKAEAEAKAKAEAEAKSKAEREAKEKLEKEGAKTATLVSVEPTAKTLTVGSSGSLALGLTSHNDYAVQGHLSLTAHKPKKIAMSFGSASFTISADGIETVKIKLSSVARAYLTRHKTLRVSLAVSTTASGMHSSNTYTITLHASGSSHHKG